MIVAVHTFMYTLESCIQHIYYLRFKLQFRKSDVGEITILRRLEINNELITKKVSISGSVIIFFIVPLL